ncbi:MAG: MinD/ParA family protein [Acidobacteriia bacterium]|nr:MinD/ParA family protein [Terriglobia bacterium]
MSNEQRGRRYAIVSGKGGVGKTVITANLAAAFASSGHRTLVLDADLGLANLDVILGINPSGTIQDVLAGNLTLEEVLVRTRGGFDLLPAGSGTLETNLLTPDLATGLSQLLDKLDTRYDSILFDAGAGIGEVVLFFARMADEIVLIVTPEPTSLMDAYAMVKILALRFGCRDFRLVVNQADPHHPEQAGTVIANHLQQVVSRFLCVDGGLPIRLHFTGSLPLDPAVSRSVTRQRLLAENDPQAPVAAIITRLAESLQTGLPGRTQEH